MAGGPSRREQPHALRPRTRPPPRRRNAHSCRRRRRRRRRRGSGDGKDDIKWDLWRAQLDHMAAYGPDGPAERARRADPPYQQRDAAKSR